MIDRCEEELCHGNNTQECLASGSGSVPINDYECVCNIGFTGRHCDVGRSHKETLYQIDVTLSFCWHCCSIVFFFLFRFLDRG